MLGIVRPQLSTNYRKQLLVFSLNLTNFTEALKLTSIVKVKYDKNTKVQHGGHNERDILLTKEIPPLVASYYILDLLQDMDLS